MGKNTLGLQLLLVCIAVFLTSTTKAQPVIKINGFKINQIDKDKQKQGEWIFFDKQGEMRLSCIYKNDKCITPLIFYDNKDTVFVKFPIVKNREDFIYYKSGNKYFGSFIHTTDSTSLIETELDAETAHDVLPGIKKYRDFTLEPVYFFAQKKLIDILAAGFTSSSFVFNKPIHAVFTISSSGLVTSVEFPTGKNNLSSDEETELYQIYSNIQRWQPFFWKNQTRPVKLAVSNGSTLSYGF